MKAYCGFKFSFLPIKIKSLSSLFKHREHPEPGDVVTPGDLSRILLPVWLYSRLYWAPPRINLRTLALSPPTLPNLRITTLATC